MSKESFEAEWRNGVYWYEGRTVHRMIIAAVMAERLRIGTTDGPTPMMPNNVIITTKTTDPQEIP